MYGFLKSISIVTLTAAAGLAYAEAPTPPPGTTTCRWVGDDKVCTTYHKAKKTYGDGHLRPAEVKQCLLDKRALAADSAQFNTDKAGVNKDAEAVNASTATLKKNADELQADGAKLQAMRAEIEALSKDAQAASEGGGMHEASRFNNDSPAKKIAAYNQRVAEFTNAQDDHNAKIAAYNASVNAQKEQIAKHTAASSVFDSREAALKLRAADINTRCVAGQQVYEEDMKAAEEAIAKEDAAQKK